LVSNVTYVIREDVIKYQSTYYQILQRVIHNYYMNLFSN